MREIMATDKEASKWSLEECTQNCIVNLEGLWEKSCLPPIDYAYVIQVLVQQRGRIEKLEALIKELEAAEQVRDE